MWITGMYYDDDGSYLCRMQHSEHFKKKKKKQCICLISIIRMVLSGVLFNLLLVIHSKFTAIHRNSQYVFYWA